MRLDVQRVRRAFSRAAPAYDAIATLQHQVEAELLDRLDLLKDAPQRILDVGAGPGRASAAMRKRFPKAEVIALDLALPMLREAKSRAGWWKPFRRVCGDARALPIADQSVDLIFSSLCLQWCEDLEAVFDEFRRVLRPGGWLLCSTFGPDTLTELRQSWAAVDDDPHVNVFIDMHDVGDRLLAAGFRDPMLDVEHYDLRYSDPKILMRELKGIGAGNADAERARGLTGKRKLATLLAAYEGFRGDDGRYRASYEVVYAQALAPDASQPRRRGGTDIAAVSIDSLRAQLKARRRES
ncbi:MAG: malonyl-ACP O-methyltransferase BioC [Xanthomonadales bacterium]|nr:malonyl-ACP O-methyltransferase BioC [Xanthomonadales bacterium]MBP6078855.1 malonyl-ACP O-methyltransferase BioC [Xanthomonadales bacterium]